MKKGLLIVYSGPSGVGKSTILAEVLKEEDLKLSFSVSMTTRDPREGEEEGVDYFFVDKETFEKAIKEDKFLEYATYVNNYYGTPKDFVEKQREKGYNVMLEIDVQGGLQVMEKCPDAVTIFIEPPSLEVLKERLIGRGTDPMDVIEQRVSRATGEIEKSATYKYHVINDDLSVAVQEVIDIIRAEMAMSESDGWWEEQPIEE
ncbi:MAG: guanylate kinase [Erysipelotrichaceae bacterium]|nr:guanylate kinase [Erysipelotrichaceae bacterium]